MRKRYTRSYRYRTPRFKWSSKDEGLLIEWERDRKGVPRRKRRGERR